MTDTGTTMNQQKKDARPSGPVASILDQLDQVAHESDSVTFGNIMDALGNRSYGPFLMLPALLGMSPVGGIPGVPTVLAAIIILFAVQMMIGLNHLWVPRFLSESSVSAERVEESVESLRPWANRLDRWFRGRLQWLTGAPFVQIAAGICVLLALAIPPLELLPFAVALPALTIAMFGLALLVSDGILMIVGYLLTGLALGGGLGVIGTNFF